jgi:hypothetical protein
MSVDVARLTRAGSWIAVCCVLLLVLPVASNASTVSLREDVVHYEAAPGEANAVSAKFEWGPEGGGGEMWTLNDTGATIIAVAPCRAVDADTAICPTPDDADLAEIDLGDLNDRLRSTTSAERGGGTLRANGGPGDDELVGGSGFNLFNGGEGNDSLVAGSDSANALDGGPGDDRIVGGPGDDLALDGGGGRDEIFGRGGADVMTDGDRDGAVGDAAPGPDLLDGGPHGCCGVDQVSYRSRTFAVSVDLGDQLSGEGDVLRGIEAIEGGRGDDQLFGDDRGNALIGRAGRDRLVGRGGKDRLVPGKGGGPIACGDGSDVVEPSTSDDQLDADCEHVDAALIYHVAAYPSEAGPNELKFRAACPEAGDDVEALLVRCSGEVQIRESSGRGRLLARGGFPPGRWEDRAVSLRLTPLGRRLTSRRHGVRATIRLAVRYKQSGLRTTVAIRWGIKLKTS